MKGFVSFYFILWLRLYCEEVLSVSSNRQWSIYTVLWRNYQVPGSLWPFATVINPAVNLGQMCPVEDGSGRGLLRVPWSLLTCGSPAPDPAMLLHSRHFDNWLDMWVGILRLWRVNYNTWQPLIWFRGLALYVFCPPSPLRYWKDEKERWWWRCYLWGEPCFPNGNCTFCWILCSLW